MLLSSENLRSLILIRGLPGAGKTSLSYILNQYVNTDDVNSVSTSADDYFTNNKEGEYRFDASKLHQAHMRCQSIAEEGMRIGANLVIVHNTFTTEKEMKPYKEAAFKYNYKVIQVIVENTHGNSSIHGVPEETIQKMEDRFTITLR